MSGRRTGLYVGPDGRRARKLADVFNVRLPDPWARPILKSVEGRYDGFMSDLAEGILLSEPEELWIGLYADNGARVAQGRGLLDISVTSTGVNGKIRVSGQFRSSERWKVWT